MSGFLQRLKERKLVQWAIAYVAAGFALLPGIDIVAQRFGWPEAIERALIVALAIGFLVTVVLAWYHGERGAQRVSGAELMIFALPLASGGGALWKFAGAPPAEMRSESFSGSHAGARGSVRRSENDSDPVSVCVSVGGRRSRAEYLSGRKAAANSSSPAPERHSDPLSLAMADVP